MLVDYYKYVGYGFPNNLVEALTDALPANYKGNDTEGWEITVRGVYQMLKERLDDRERDVLLHRRTGSGPRAASAGLAAVGRQQLSAYRGAGLRGL